MNLSGALLACLAGAYWLMPSIGLRGALWLCGFIGVGVWIASRSLPEEQSSESVPPTTADEVPAPVGGEAGVMLVSSFISGLIFFALEVVWTHLISTTLGSSVYAFSSMLIMVLAGLAIGALRVRRTLSANRPLLFSRMFQLSALLLVCQIRCWDWIQGLFLTPLPEWLRNFWGVELFKLGMAAILIVPSAAMLGSVFPALLGSPILKRAGRSYMVGYLNTANSVGCLMGALAGIFVLIPGLGSELSLKLMTATLLLLSFLFLWSEKASRKMMFQAAIGAALVLGYTVTWKWNRILMTSGMNVYFGQPDQPPAPGPKPLASSLEMIYFDEHPQGGFTTVVEMRDKYTDRTETARMLLSNGKFQGNDVFSAEGLAQVGFAAIPSLFVRNFDRSLLIGLGTGQSAKALTELGYKRVDVAEYSPGIVDAARKLFGRANEGVLEDARVHLYLEDGRNVLLTREDKYDLITLEITSIWFAGTTNLYSKEFYELAARRINPGGVLHQWVQLHHIGPEEIASAIATVRQVFPYVSLWYFGDQGMIIATREPQTIDSAGVDRASAAMAHFGTGREVEGLADRMIRSQLMTPAAVDRMILAMKPVINTDHNRWIEYSTPRYNASKENWAQHNSGFFRGFEAPGRAEARPFSR
jgi:spermidine synthase